MNQELLITGWQKPKLTRVGIRVMVAALLFVTAVSHFANAQSGAPGASVYTEGRAAQGPAPRISQVKKSVIERRLESLTNELNLNQVQRAQTRKILEDGEAESLRLWKDQRLAPIDRMVKLRSIREDAQKKFRALLTKDQETKYDQIYNREVQAYALPHNKASVNTSTKSQ